MGFLNKTSKFLDFLRGLLSLQYEMLYSLLQIATDYVLKLLKQLLNIFYFDKMVFYYTLKLPFLLAVNLFVGIGYFLFTINRYFGENILHHKFCLLILRIYFLGLNVFIRLDHLDTAEKVFVRIIIFKQVWKHHAFKIKYLRENALS